MNVQTQIGNDIDERLDQLIAQGGPEVWEYQEMDYLIDDLAQQVRNGEFEKDSLDQIRERFGHAFSQETMQGFVYQKPHGYSGDYEIIDRIYSYYRAENRSLTKWDLYLQNHPAARAVRNRKEFFKEQLHQMCPNGHGDVLNLASGPCTDLREYFEIHPNSGISFDCVELDQEAIKYASDKLAEYIQSVTFIHQNIFRFTPTRQYDLIWSAGLFDYFDDATFVRILSRYKMSLKSGGVIMIGNFDVSNRSRNYMELCNWNLFHRSAQRLLDLGKEALGEDFAYDVLEEREGVNLFLRVIKRPPSRRAEQRCSAPLSEDNGVQPVGGKKGLKWRRG